MMCTETITARQSFKQGKKERIIPKKLTATISKKYGKFIQKLTTKLEINVERS